MTPIITGEILPDPLRWLLQDVMRETGVPHCQVTSMARTPADQARIMYDNCDAPLPPSLEGKYKDSVARQYALYAASGDAVVRIYADNHAILTREECIALMEKKILEIGPEKVSRHCAGKDAPYWVIDIAPSSIPDDLEPAFIEALKKHPRTQVDDKGKPKVFTPPADPAIHWECLK